MEKKTLIFRLFCIIALIVLTALMGVQVYRPVDCLSLFVDLDKPGNVTVFHANGNTERWTSDDPAIYGSRAAGADGLFIKPDDWVLVEQPTFVNVKCMKGEEE